MPLYQKHTAKKLIDISKSIYSGFLDNYTNSDIHQTHFFAGRYENIYLNEKHIPELNKLEAYIVNEAEKVLKTKGLRAGYWFNYMPPGSTTTLHTHDDDDELLSAVYYLHVPENSGNLIIYSADMKDKIEITPKAGELIFFTPDTKHEVSRNDSQQYRLSIGINFGKDDN